MTASGDLLRGSIDGRSMAERVAALSTSERRDFFASMTEERAAELMYEWDFWARPDQMLPRWNPRMNSPEWFVWALISGRGAEKTRTGAETISALARAAAGSGP